MKKSQKEKINLKNILIILSVVIGVILLFTFFDYLVHLLKEEYSVPEYYFRNKIIFGVIWGFLTLLILFKWKPKIWIKSIVFSTIISILLQARYLYEGYSLDFVIEFLFIHFGILFLISYATFKLINKKINIF